jgi:hypothetical protein
MSVPVPVLDDLTWDTMMQAVRRQIPAESGGRWTLHAPVDPGITVLELFAYLLEQRLYRLDQVPDELVVAVLRLLGVAPPKPATAAATVLQLVSAAPDGQVVTVPVGTVFTRDPAESLTFTLGQDVTVLPLAPDPPQVWAGGKDLSADLAAGRGVPLLSAGGAADQFQIALRPDPDGGLPPTGTALSLLFALDADVSCPPAWSPGAVDGVPPPAALTFTWYEPAPDGSVARTVGAPSTVDDGTAGLRRSGVVRLALPDQWCAGGADTPPDRYGLLVATQAATYSTAPVLLALVPNTGNARHRETRTVTDADPDIAEQVRAWLRLPGQRLLLPDGAGLLVSATVELRRDGQVGRWQAVPDFTFGGPADQIFVLDRADGAVRFGDGLTGAIPVPDPLPEPGTGGEPVVTVEYARGGGPAGNGGLTGNWFTVTPLPAASAAGLAMAGPTGVVTARNPVPAEGGADAETVSAAKLRAAQELAAVYRAVTGADFIELATTTPGVAVARAYVGVGEHPRYPCTPVPGAVTVQVVPRVPRTDADLAAATYTAAVQPDPGVLAQVCRHLDPARLIGTELFVCRPRYRSTALRVDLSSRPADPAGVRDALLAALRRYLDPLVGGDDGTGWPFGDPLRPSALLRVAQDAVGDAVDVAGVAIGLDGTAPSAECFDVPVRAGDLVSLESVQVQVRSSGGV